MERRSAEQIAADRPVADVTESSQVPIGRGNCATGATRLELLDGFGTLESLCRQLAELRCQNAELTQCGVATLETLDLDVPFSIQLEQFGNGCWLAGGRLGTRSDAGVLARRDLRDELRLPALLRFLLRRHRSRCASREREVIH